MVGVQGDLNNGENSVNELVDNAELQTTKMLKMTKSYPVC